MSQQNNPESAALGGRKKMLWAALSAVIAGLTIWAVTSQWKGFSLGAFLEYVSRANPVYLALAVAAMLGFVGFEGLAVKSACHALRYDVPLRRYFCYSAADIYFSAITPSATGGQPACAFLMMRDGIPGIVTTAALLLTLAMYSLSILVLGVLAMLFFPHVLAAYAVPSRVLIFAGFGIQILLVIFIVMLIRSETLLEGICRGAIHLLAKLHIVKHEDRRQAKLKETMAEYVRCVGLLSGHRPMLVQSFLFNLVQRVSQIAVTMLVFLAMGGSVRQAGSVFAMQCLVVLGSNSVPIPGAMGVADYLMIDGFNAFLHQDQVVSMELLSRSISFYSCVLLCGLTVLISTYTSRKAYRR